MGIFDFFKITNINEELKKKEDIPGSLLIDVRSKEEYKKGHIPKSINIPVDDIFDIDKITEDKDTYIFVYCLSGARSRKAVSRLHMFGYKNAKSIGGIASYKGMIVM